MNRWLDSVTAFLLSPAGQILIRVICVTVAGAAPYIIIMNIEKIKAYRKSAERKNKMKLISQIISYVSIILISIMIGYKYHRVGLDMIDFLIESILYGLGAVTVFYIFESGTLINFIKIFRRKK